MFRERRKDIALEELELCYWSRGWWACGKRRREIERGCRERPVKVVSGATEGELDGTQKRGWGKMLERTCYAIRG